MNNMVGIGPGCSSLYSYLILVGFKNANAHWAKSIQCESAEFSKTEHFVYLKFILK